jgi:hypothetical protein
MSSNRSLTSCCRLKVLCRIVEEEEEVRSNPSVALYGDYQSTRCCSATIFSLEVLLFTVGLQCSVFKRNSDASLSSAVC